MRSLRFGAAGKRGADMIWRIRAHCLSSRIVRPKLKSTRIFFTKARAAELPDFLRDRFRVVKVPAPRLIDLPLLAASIVDAMLLEEGDEWAGSVAPFAPDELLIIAKAWEKRGMSMRALQKIVFATLEARDACQMRH
ncbi:hypothetical protein [Bradyrhizobium sp. MOS003]|uniref:hypothetical protein n=1 Tax=Bradyrhizobium sp. MOS003 TaxID=2133946 RepID=UPI000D13C4D0|nr:hypothetical protein [Bradyrhizobium sp. MOS003]PSO13794.1 hypothetical protein C7G42_34560 [Bradyrhizobium sp. MOS003]